MGVSLGGQTAYYTSVLLSQNKDVKIHAPVQSVIAFCPVINLEPTVRILDSKFLFGNQFRKLMLISGAELLAQMKDASPITQADLDGLTKGNLADTLARVGLPRLDNAINKKHLLKPPFAGTPFKDANDFWHLSDGFNYVSDIQIPTWIIYSKDDQIVAPEENGQKLKMLMATQGNSNLHFIEQSHGTHCANVEAYGWPAISSMWRTIVLSQTRSAGGLKIHRMPLNQTSKGNSGLNLDSGTGKSVDAYEWKMNGPKRVKLTVHMFQPNRRIGQMSCQTFDRSVAFEGCFDQSEFEFNLADLFGAQWIEESKAIGEDVDSLTRWLNTRATLIDDAGASVIRSGTVPTAVQWYSDLP
jgi:pimeloyl-ACP methyl ester carboxylesterase